MTAPEIAQLVALAFAAAWVLVLIVVARMWCNTPDEIYTQEELSQILATENKKHQPRPRLRAGSITERSHHEQ
jgi:hypothetical protein